MNNFLNLSKITTLVVTTPKGLGPILKSEIEGLGYSVIATSTMSVSLKGTFSDAMKLNLYLRCAHHVLYQLNEFYCNGTDELYKEINKIPWETIISPNAYLSVVSNVDHPSIRDSRFANMKSKDAIVDRILSRKGKRPDSGPERTGAVVSIYWKNERCLVYIDTSGEPLSRRGYRLNPMNAPMQETLAAGIILTGNYNGNCNFVNPMCGSGTIAIEAALIQANIAPGLLRKNFGFLNTLLCNRTEWNELCVNARSQIKLRLSTNTIIATDINEEAVVAAKKNAESAGVLDRINFAVCDIRETTVPTGNGCVMLNPEYGIRLGNEADLEETYRKIGGFLKNDCAGYTGYVFTANTKLAGKIGLKSKRKIPFNSGTIECRLYVYELYAGTKEK